MSSCEAELNALAEAAIELLHVVEVVTLLPRARRDVLAHRGPHGQQGGLALARWEILPYTRAPRTISASSRYMSCAASCASLFFDPNFASAHATPAHVDALSAVRPLLNLGFVPKLKAEARAARGGDSHCQTDGDDGDGQGGRFLA
jgi:hypothetical protein